MYFEVKSSEQFEHFTSKSMGCVVDFHAEWCGPCKRLAPLLEAKMLADESILPFIVTPDQYAKNSDISDKIIFLKVNVDVLADIANIFNVSAIPYFVFYKKGSLQSHTIKGGDIVAISAEIKKLLD
jgi:thioredoxin-like negative regulator of GroEL